MMHLFLADLTLSVWPSFFAFGAGLVGLVGVVAAYMAANEVKQDRKLIELASNLLVSPGSWVGSHTHSEQDLTTWLGKLGIKSDSGVADVILTCWSAWLGSRPPALNEIHVLVARRERTKIAVRLSGGIAALLLVIGIAGTLVSVKPVLENFVFKSSVPKAAQANQDGGLVSVVENVDLINRLMQNLGEAFMPSLVALIATVIVAIFRGIYTLGLHRYTLELDRFAIRTVMPHFRPRSVSDEFASVRSSFESLAQSIEKREGRLDSVVNSLVGFTQTLEPTLSSMGSTLGKMSGAAEALDSKSRSLAETLVKTLGRKSPLYEAVQNFDALFKRATAELNLLSNIAVKLSKNEDAHHAALQQHLEKLNGVVLSLQTGVKTGQGDLLNAAAAIKTLIETFPKEATNQSRDVFEKGVKAMEERLGTFVDDQRRASQEMRSQLLSGFDQNTAAIQKNLEILGEESKQILEKATTSLAQGQTILQNASEVITKLDHAAQAWEQKSIEPNEADKPASPQEQAANKVYDDEAKKWWFWQR
jgi:exonuclease VII small subunit